MSDESDSESDDSTTESNDDSSTSSTNENGAGCNDTTVTSSDLSTAADASLLEPHKTEDQALHNDRQESLNDVSNQALNAKCTICREAGSPDMPILSLAYLARFSKKYKVSLHP